MKFIEGAGNLRPIVGTTFVLASDPPTHRGGGGLLKRQPECVGLAL